MSKRVGCQSVARQTDGRPPKRLMFAKGLVGERARAGGRPEQSWLRYLVEDFEAFGATHGSTGVEQFVFGVPDLFWTEAAKVKGGVP